MWFSFHCEFISSFFSFYFTFLIFVLCVYVILYDACIYVMISVSYYVCSIIENVFKYHSLQRHQNPFSPLLVTTHFLNFVTPPPPPTSTSWHLSLSLIVSKYINSICIKPVMTIWWRLLRRGSIKYKARLSQVVLHEISF